MSKQFWPKMLYQREGIAYQNLIFSLSGSLGLNAFQSFYEAICMFAQMFFKRSDIKYQILNVKITFAPNIERPLRSSQAFFLITYVHI